MRWLFRSSDSRHVDGLTAGHSFYSPSKLLRHQTHTWKGSPSTLVRENRDILFFAFGMKFIGGR
jgi:hypothetical protein